MNHVNNTHSPSTRTPVAHTVQMALGVLIVAVLTVAIHVVVHNIIVERGSQAALNDGGQDPDLEFTRQDTADNDSAVTDSILPAVGPGITAGIPVGMHKPDGTSSRCTLGPVLNERIALIAAHCADGQVNTRVSSDLTDQVFGGVIRIHESADIAMISLNTGSTARPRTDTPVDFGTPQPGEPLAKHGRTTGATTGQVTKIDRSGQTAQTSLCLLPGDSGAAVYNSRGEAVAMASGYISTPGDLSDGEDVSCTRGYVRSDVVLLSAAMDMFA